MNIESRTATLTAVKKSRTLNLQITKFAGEDRIEITLKDFFKDYEKEFDDERQYELYSLVPEFCQNAVELFKEYVGDGEDGVKYSFDLPDAILTADTSEKGFNGMNTFVQAIDESFEYAVEQELETRAVQDTNEWLNRTQFY